MEREAFLYVKAKLLNSSNENRNNLGSGKVHFNLTGTYMNDPILPPQPPTSTINNYRVFREQAKRRISLDREKGFGINS